MTDGGWRSLFAEASGFLDLSPVPLEVDGAPGGLPSKLPAAQAATACVAAALTAAGGLQCQRGGRLPPVRLDSAHVTAAVRSEAHLRVNGRALGSGFAPLSRFWRAADGWVRTHANYPWHREALLRALGAADDPDGVNAAIAERPAGAVEADGTHAFTLSLAATAAWLLRHPGVAVTGAVPAWPPAAERLATLQSHDGPVTMVTPPGVLGGRPLAWPPRLASYGQDAPVWQADGVSGQVEPVEIHDLVPRRHEVTRELLP